MSQGIEPIVMNPFSEYALLVEHDDYAKSEIVMQQIKGPLDPSAFAKAFDESLKLVPILSCNMVERKIGWKYTPTWIPNLDVKNRMIVEDCRHLVSEPFDLGAFADMYFAERIRRRIDLAREFPFRGHLVRMGEDTWMMALVFHHSAMDPYKGYKIMTATLANYYNKVTGEVPDWFDTAGSLASARKNALVKPIPALTFAREQLMDVWVKNRASVISPIAGKGLRNWHETKGRHCFHTRIDDGKLIQAIVDRAIKVDCTFNDLLLAVTRQVLSGWNKDHGQPADRFRMMLATSLVGRADVAIEAGAALGALNFISRDQQNADLETIMRTIGAQRKEQLTRGVDVTFHKTLDRVVNGLRFMPLKVRTRLMRPSIERIPCTVSLSNTGSIWPKSVDEKGRQSLESRIVDIAGAKIQKWHTNVSIARNLGLGLTCRTYNGTFFLDFVYDRFRFRWEEAKEITDRIYAAIENAG
jgi:hypothetical protein